MKLETWEGKMKEEMKNEFWFDSSSPWPSPSLYSSSSLSLSLSFSLSRTERSQSSLREERKSERVSEWVKISATIGCGFEKKLSFLKHKQKISHHENSLLFRQFHFTVEIDWKNESERERERGQSQEHEFWYWVLRIIRSTSWVFRREGKTLMNEERLSFTERERDKERKEEEREKPRVDVDERQGGRTNGIRSDDDYRLGEKKEWGRKGPLVIVSLSSHSLFLSLFLSFIPFLLSTSSFLQTIVFSFREPSSFYAPRDSSCLLHSVLSINRGKRERRREEEREYFFHWPLTWVNEFVKKERESKWWVRIRGRKRGNG